MPNSHATPRKRDDQGIVALEFMFVVPFLVLLIVAIAEFGLYFSWKVETESTARDAARTLALGGPTAVVSTPAGWTLVPPTVKCATGDTTNNATVTFSRTYTFTFPAAPSFTKTIQATGKMRCGG
jgi:Flp pilus assembly protein TadG